jgi:uncharacterized protein (TIGR02118 family)
MDLMEDQPTPQSPEGEAKVVTLCGSSTFQAEFAEVDQRLTMEGCVVISLGMFSLPDLPDYDWTADRSDLKGRLGRVHVQKIRMADEVYVVDPGGYVGESTRREIAYAESLGKPVRYLSRERVARTGARNHTPGHRKAADTDARQRGDARSMHKITVQYFDPADGDDFVTAYRERHVPLVQAVPGLERFTISLPHDDGAPYLVAELWFADGDALGTAGASAEMAVVRADSATYDVARRVIFAGSVEDV